MLTRLTIKGFKNLFDCEVAFGPFTCVAGINASGKSNLFDAIMFLRDLADYSIVEAASRIRDNSGRRATNLKSLFTALPNGDVNDIELEAEFLVQKIVLDDFGREAQPSATHLKYKITLRYIQSSGQTPERIELIHESLKYVLKTESRKRLGFKTSAEFWNSVIGGARRADFISTESNGSVPVIRLRQDGHQGRPLDIPAPNSPRTILSTINTDDKPTALAARREMQSWRLLQLEPSKLRLPDDFSDESKVSPEGAHMPATLARLEKYSEVANRLSDLLPEVRTVEVDVDEGRRLKTLVVSQRDGSSHTARSLSDGTLRFLALAIISADSSSGGLICLEEPENGIHPSRVRAMMELLGDIASDPELPVGQDNPLRQIIINTHSPLVVQKLSKDNLLVSLPVKSGRISTTIFAPIEDTWRTTDKNKVPTVPLGTLLSYLSDDEKKESLSISSVEKPTVHDFVRGQLSLFNY
jgi:predicted ATPase